MTRLYAIGDGMGVDPINNSIPWAVLHDVLREKGGLGGVSRLGSAPTLADGTHKFLIRDLRGRPLAVLLLSSPGNSFMVARGIERAGQAKMALGPALGRVILTPLAAGVMDGLTFAVLPYCRRLSENRLWWRVQRTWVRRDVLEWLRCVTETTVADPAPDRIEPDFLVPLRALGANLLVDADIREEALRSADRLEAGRWRARHVFAHNDLWKENILLPPRVLPGDSERTGQYRFALIDWGSAAVRGYPMYDLVRLARDMRVSGSALTREIAAHCRFLECAPADALSHLLAALGALGMHLEQFPMERYVALVRGCRSFLLRSRVVSR